VIGVFRSSLNVRRHEWTAAQEATRGNFGFAAVNIATSSTT
jgi:hypothetical protein